MRDSFVIHTAYAEKFKRLTDEQFGKLIRLLMLYQSTGDIQDINDPAVAFAFDVAKVELDFSNKKYAEVCEKRRKAGSMGGAPKGNQNARKTSKNNQNQAKQANASKTSIMSNEIMSNENEIMNNDNDNDNDSLYISNTQKINSNNIPKEKSIKESRRYFPDDDLLEKTFADFRDMRKQIKKPMTDRAITLLLNKLGKLSSDPSEQVKILEQSIMNCWQDIYELKDQQRGKQTKIQSIEDVWANVH